MHRWGLDESSCICFCICLVIYNLFGLDIGALFPSLKHIDFGIVKPSTHTIFNQKDVIIV